MSSYVIDRCSQKYGGGNQQNFTDRSAIMASTTAALIKRAVDNFDDLEQLFHKTLESLSKARHQLALEYKITDAESFGIRRDGQAFDDIANCTYLSHALLEYNERVTATVQKHLSKLQPFSSDDMTIPTTSWLGRKASLTYRVLKGDEIFKWGFEFSCERHQLLCRWCEVSTDDYPFSVENVVKLGKNKEAMVNLKKNAPKEYQRFKLDACIGEYHTQYPETIKSDFILVTVRDEVDGKMFALSQYFLNFPSAPTIAQRIEAIKDRSIVLLIHQDVFLLEPMLADIAKVFKQAILCHTNDLNSLKQHMALFKYQFSHAKPFFRGSAAISEWMERAVYAYQGYAVIYNNNKMPSFEARTSSLKEFADNYDSIVNIVSK